jgi:uncharacterized protein
MATGGLLALLDDITAILDDVAAMSKVAATKTAGITGDDLAVNAQALVGIDPSRELPIVWRVAKGSLKNKFILVPSALLLSVVAEWAITPLLMIGGAYLCYEGAEKIVHAVHPTREDEKHHKKLTAAAEKSAEALLTLEQEKIRQAVNTDFILSAEIVAVALGAVKEAEFAVQASVLAAVGIGMTVVVYGLVGGIVKLDDLGMHLTGRRSRAARMAGNLILRFAPYLMKTLSVVGTAAMLTVGGGIILHGIPPANDALHGLHGLVNIIVTTVAGAAAGFALIPVAHRLEKPAARLKDRLVKKYRKLRRKA